MAATNLDNQRYGTALIEHTWLGKHGVIVVADEPKGDNWVLPGGVVERDESRMATALRELVKKTGMAPYAVLYLFDYASLNEHEVYLVRANGSPGMRSSEVKALGLLLPDLSVAKISIRKRHEWPTALSPSTHKIAERFYDLRAKQSAFFQAFDTYTVGTNADACSFNGEDRSLRMDE